MQELPELGSASEYQFMSPSLLVEQTEAYLGILAYLQDSYSVFPATLPGAHFSSTQRELAVSTGCHLTHLVSLPRAATAW